MMGINHTWFSNLMLDSDSSFGELSHLNKSDHKNALHHRTPAE